MPNFTLVTLSLCLFAIVHGFEIGKFEVYQDQTRAKRLFAYEKDLSLTENLLFGENSYFELEILDQAAGSKVKPVQVALLLSQVSFIGSSSDILPSIQVPMQTSSAGGLLFRGSLSPSIRRQLDPSGSVFTVDLLVANAADSTFRKSLGRVTLTKSAPIGGIPHRIDHQFKPQSERSNWVITTLFIFLVFAAPLGSFGSGLKYLRLNTMGLDRISGIFFVGVAAFVGIITMFFIALNLVQTVSLALILAVPMCVVGNKLLCQMRTCGDLSF